MSKIDFNIIPRFNLHVHCKERSSDAKMSNGIIDKYSAEHNISKVYTDHDQFCENTLSDGKVVVSSEVSTVVNLFGLHTFHLLVYIPLVKVLPTDTLEQKEIKLLEIKKQKAIIESIEAEIKNSDLDSPENTTRRWFSRLKIGFGISDQKVNEIMKKYGPFISTREKFFDDEKTNYEYINNKNYAKMKKILLEEFCMGEQSADEHIRIPYKSTSTSFEAQRLMAKVHSAGGYVVMAHPSHTLKKIYDMVRPDEVLHPIDEENILDDLMTRGDLRGIDGIEIPLKDFNRYNPTLSTRQKENFEYKSVICGHFLRLAKKHDLYVSSGTDFHGKAYETIEEVGGFNGQGILYCDLLKALDPELAEKTQKQLVDLGVMKTEDKICVASKYDERQRII